MNQERPEPPPKDQTLDYWRPASRPLNPLLRALCVLGGMAIGAIVMGFVGTMLMFGVISGLKTSMPHVNPPLIVGIIIAAGFVARLVVYQYRGRQLSIEARLRGPRYFAAGFMLGCCLTILLQGLCFGAMN